MSKISVLDKQTLLAVIETQTEITQAGLELQGVMTAVAEKSASLTGADGAVVELLEREEMVYRATSGLARSQLGLRIPSKGSLSGLCVATGEILICQDSEADARVDRDACRRVGLRSMIVVPLKHLGKTVGVIKVLGARPNQFDDRAVQVLGLMSELVAAAMHNAARHEANDLYVRATHDALTGLANRALYYDRLRQQLALARRNAERLGILYVDMDNLKPINDTLGHRAGDAALIELARRLQAQRRETDTVARLGGDEFGLILPQLESAEALAMLSTQLMTDIEDEPFAFAGRDLALRASVGYAVFPDHATEIDELLVRADGSMYSAKRVRKGRFAGLSSRPPRKVDQPLH